MIFHFVRLVATNIENTLKVKSQVWLYKYNYYLYLAKLLIMKMLSYEGFGFVIGR